MAQFNDITISVSDMTRQIVGLNEDERKWKMLEMLIFGKFFTKKIIPV